MILWKRSQSTTGRTMTGSKNLAALALLLLSTPLQSQAQNTTCQSSFNLCVSLDSSGSVSWSGWRTIKDFAAQLITDMHAVAENGNVTLAVSAVMFDDYGTLLSPLTTNETATISAIQSADFGNGMTNHGEAISVCQDTLDTRPGENNILLLVTDGSATRPNSDPKGFGNLKADEAKAAGTQIFPIFVDVSDIQEAVMPYMLGLSSDNSTYFISEFDQLGSLYDSLTDKICSSLPEPTTRSPSPSSAPSSMPSRTCNGQSPLSQNDLDAITKMTGTHGGSTPMCSTTMIHTTNPDIPLNTDLVYCDKADDDSSFVLEFPRCATDCTVATLTTQSCSRVCETGWKCCPTTGGSCIPSAETCPCPACAETRRNPPQCDASGPDFFMMESTGASVACCIPVSSLVPSSIPSVIASSTPSVAASSIPSSMPSVAASAVPSSMPSAIPSESAVPSSMPSVGPSAVPSETPSDSSAPSLNPSVSFNPSDTPSDSSAPSLWPTVSLNPSKVPSVSAFPSVSPSKSLRPSDNPSISSSPSASPTGFPSTTHLWYPDFSATAKGCLNDGNEEPYMRRVPSFYLYSTYKECCESRFQWDVEGCYDASIGPAKWYPDLGNGQTGSSSGKCINGHMHPASKLNAYSMTAYQLMKEFLFDTEVACCESYFPGSTTCLVDSLAGNLWYPDWSDTGQGCLNDGNEEPYMKVNPIDYMFPTYELCCLTLFGWDLETCFETSTGLSSSSSSSTVQGLWYPDWRPSATSCLNDGNEKPYMVLNPSWYLYPTFRECCERRFEWDVEGCMGSNIDPVTSSLSGSSSSSGSSTSSSSTAQGLWYPDWRPGATSCLNDRNEKPYMLASPSWYLYATFRECCENRFGWDVEGCIGSNVDPVTSSSSGSSSSGTTGTSITGSSVGAGTEGSSNNLNSNVQVAQGLWYPDWRPGTTGCVNDGNEKPYMLVNSAWYLHPTLQECCQTRFSWDVEGCRENSSSGSSSVGSTAGSVSTASYSNKLFAVDITGSCQRDCLAQAGSFTCVAAPASATLYDTVQACCTLGLMWVNPDYCASRSIGGYTNGWSARTNEATCVKDCDPANGPPCVSHTDFTAKIFTTKAECCTTMVGWAPDLCLSLGLS